MVIRTRVFIVCTYNKADTNFDFLLCHRPLGKFWLEFNILTPHTNKFYKKFKKNRVKLESLRKFLNKSDEFNDFA